MKRKVLILVVMPVLIAMILGGLAYFIGPIPDKPVVSSRPEPSKKPRMLNLSEQTQLFEGNYNVVRSTAALPARCKDAFARTTHLSQFELAEPGERFQSTDVIEKPSLPMTRLIFGGFSDARCFIHYEHGGIGLSYNVAVFDISQQSPTLLWGAFGVKAADLQQLRTEIADAQFRQW